MSNVQPASAIVFPGQGSQQPGMAQTSQDHPAFTLWAQPGDQRLEPPLTWRTISQPEDLA